MPKVPTPRLFLAGVALAVVGLLAACVPGTPGIVGNSANCATPIINGQMSMAAFVGHKVVVRYSYCKGLSGIKYIATPAVSTPTSSPLGGLFESVQVARLPYTSYLSTWHDEVNFDVRQQVFHVAGTQTFTFVIKFDSARATQMCLGRTCVSGP